MSLNAILPELPDNPDVPLRPNRTVTDRLIKKSQRDFLLTLFNNNGGPKIVVMFIMNQ